MGSKQFFTKLYTRQERERVFSLLADSQQAFQCQLSNKSIVILKPVKRIGGSIQVTSMGKLPVEDQVILSFSVPPESFFMQTKLFRLGPVHHIDLSTPLYKLQRRDTFRLPLPAGYNSRVQLKAVNKKDFTLMMPLHDLSGGGFSFETRPDSKVVLKKEDIVSGVLQVGSGFTKDFTAHVRYARVVGSMGSGVHRFGVAFVDMPTSDKEDIVQLVMGLHRDLFSKFKLG